jgi:hypothetical protein
MINFLKNMSTLKKLKNNIGKEVFLIGADILFEKSRPITIATNKRLLSRYLKTENVNSSLIVIHGIITSGKILPIDAIINTDIFIIIENQDDSFIIYVQSVQEIIDVISIVLENKDLKASTLEDYNYDLADALFSANANSIDNIFILYGYQVPLEVKIHTIMNDVIKKSKKIYNKL